MEIEFDPVKDVVNIRKHGISLRRAEDFVSMADHEDGRFDYGEIRYRAYGHIGDVAYCLVFTVRAHSIRAISLRRAHAKEMTRYAS
jgi:uncharacterized DUF497 family protein